MNKRSALALTALTLLFGSKPALADITNNLVAYYNFEGLTGRSEKPWWTRPAEDTTAYAARTRTP